MCCTVVYTSSIDIPSCYLEGVTMKYEVLETQNHTEPIEDWTVVFTTDNEDIACEWMTKHYNTQISDEENYDPATDCGCEDCADGFRVADWQGLTMQLCTFFTIDGAEVFNDEEGK